MAIYLGFDSSTQSLTVIAIEVDGSRRTVIYEDSVGFDAGFRERKERGTKTNVDL